IGYIPADQGSRLRWSARPHRYVQIEHIVLLIYKLAETDETPGGRFFVGSLNSMGWVRDRRTFPQLIPHSLSDHKIDGQKR
ncbi:hypothetical protein, partial [Adlercreutzia shanghongiae]